LNPVIIIGAGRSGTNILRDVLCRVNGLETWPCDEINYIWRHGNVNEETDEFGPQHVTPTVKKYIRNVFQKIANGSNAETVVEKTCANSLRVPFVNEIFPEARFIHIVRDGRDVVNSARKRWTADLELDYIWQKAKYIPLTDIPYYGFKYLGNRVHRLFSDDGQLASWGPRFKGIDEAVQNYSLEEVCAIQWKRCVEKATEQLSELDTDRVFTLNYEDFALNTGEELKEILTFCNIDRSTVNIQELSGMVHSNSEGKWKRQLHDEQVEKIMKILKSTLEKIGIN